MSAPDFDEILDGYFPLRLSIAQMMQRRGLRHVALRLIHAPILLVPGLPPDAPVPLNIRSGRAGMITSAQLLASHDGGRTTLSGQARWHWLDGTEVPPQFDPMIRLAEPAIVEGAIGPHLSAGVEIATLR